MVPLRPLRVIPSASFTPNTGRPLPKLHSTTLTSGGLRLRIGRTAPSPYESAAVSACLSNATVHAADSKQKDGETCADEGIDVAKTPSEADRLEHWQRLAERSRGPISLTIGARYLYRSEALTGNAPGVAGEIPAEILIVEQRRAVRRTPRNQTKSPRKAGKRNSSRFSRVRRAAT